MATWIEILTKNTHSLGFKDIREGLTLIRLILRGLECVIFYLCR